MAAVGKRESTTVKLLAKLRDEGQLSQEEFQSVATFWEELTLPDPQARTDAMKSFLDVSFPGPATLGHHGLARGAEIWLTMQKEGGNRRQPQQPDQQQQQLAEMMQAQELQQLQQLQQLQYQAAQKKAAKKAKTAAAAAGAQHHQLQLYQQQQQQQQQMLIQQQQQQQQQLPDIFNELVDKEEAYDRTQDPNLTIGPVTSQKIVDLDLEATEGEQATRMMRDGIVSSSSTKGGASSSGGAGSGDQQTSQNWYDTNILDYTLLQKVYKELQDKTGMLPTGQGMRLLSKALQAHASKVLRIAYQQSQRRTSEQGLKEYGALYVLAAENPALRGELYSMKWGPDVLGAVKADEEAARIAILASGKAVVDRVKAAAAAMSAAESSSGAAGGGGGGGGRKRKAAESGGGEDEPRAVPASEPPFWETLQAAAAQNKLGLEELAYLQYAENCLPPGRRFAPSSIASPPIGSAANQSQASAAAAAAGTVQPMSIADAYEGEGVGRRTQTDLLQAQRNRIKAAVMKDCPINRSTQPAKILKSDVIVALSDFKAATTSPKILQHLLYPPKSKAKAPGAGAETGK